MTSSIDLNSIFIESLSLPLYLQKRVSVSVLRLDRIHPHISGNKWFKLRFYLEEAKRTGKNTIVTWGGTWSNHIAAAAAAAELFEFKCIGLIRGEENVYPSPVLHQARESGMVIRFMTRDEYRNKKIPDDLASDHLCFFIDEGGYGPHGVTGAATILNHCQKENYSHFCCATGTGTMAAGLIRAAGPDQTVIAVSVLKNNLGVEEKIRSVAGNTVADLKIIHDYHFGGYARFKPVLINFMNDFFSETGIPTDFVYTAKLFFAVHDLITKDFFPAGSKLLVIHSGGLTGNYSLNKGTLIF